MSVQSSIAQARARLADLAPGLNPAVYGALQAELEASEAVARQRGESHVTDLLGRVNETRQTLHAEAAEVRDAFDALAAQAEVGLISASDYAAELRKLEGRLAQALNRTDTLDNLTGQLAEVEDDPVAFTDRLYDRYPSLAPEWSW